MTEDWLQCNWHLWNRSQKLFFWNHLGLNLENEMCNNISAIPFLQNFIFTGQFLSAVIIWRKVYQEVIWWHVNIWHMQKMFLLFIQSWAGQWLVYFSPAKTKSMTASFEKYIRQPPILFNNTIIFNLFNHKHLEITLINTLNWSLHINSIVNIVDQMANV